MSGWRSATNLDAGNDRRWSSRLSMVGLGAAGQHVAAGVAVDLHGYAVPRRSRPLSGPAMEHARIAEVGAAEDFPQIIQRLKWPWFAENDHVEPAIVVARDGDKRQPQRIPGQVEDEDGRAGQDLLGVRVDDPHRDRREPVREARPQDRPDVGDPMGGPDASPSATRVP